MSSFASFFKRPRSKSEKAGTPPKIVYGDLDAAYASIAQKPSPITPHERRGGEERISFPAQTDVPWSPVQSPHSTASPSAPLLKHSSPDAIRASHLSGDLFLPEGFGNDRSKANLGSAWDPFVSRSADQDQGSFTTLDFKKHILDEYFDTDAGKDSKADSRVTQDASQRETKLLPATDFPELGQAQLEACSKLSGVDQTESSQDNPLDRCGTIQSLSTRHEYGRVETNADIRSLYGAHSTVGDAEERLNATAGNIADLDFGLQRSASSQLEEVEQVEWSPRPSEELEVFERSKAQVYKTAGGPPSAMLPRTPKAKEVVRDYGKAYPSSAIDEVSHSPESYGNTRKLLQLSVPQFPQTPAQGDDFFERLINFAKEGQSSSSHGTSGKSFATFSIEESRGNIITRPVSQGEFQGLEQEISSHLRLREGQGHAEAASGDLVRVGQISLRFLDGSEVDEYRAPSSQTVSSSRSDVDAASSHGAVQPPVRTRNGTPPLLFGSLNQTKTETDWETVGDSNELSSSIADYSDSASRSPPKDSVLMAAGKVLRHPAHPRYNHSWDLQQDVRSGAYVLTPRYELSGGSSFPNRNAVEPLSMRKNITPYAHPTPLTVSHSHPFTSPPPEIALLQNASAHEAGQHININTTGEPLQSQGSSNWLSTAAGSVSRAATSFTGARNSLLAPRVPPIPKRSPWRQVKKLVSGEQIELQGGVNPKARSDPELVKNTSNKMEQTTSIKHEGKDLADVSTISTMASGAEGPSSHVRLRSPHRQTGGKHPPTLTSVPSPVLYELTTADINGDNQHANHLNQPALHSRGRNHRFSDEEELLNPFDDPITIPARAQVATNASAGALGAVNDEAGNSTANRSLAAMAGSFTVNEDASGLTPPRNLVIAGTPGTPTRRTGVMSITAEQVEYLRTRPADWDPDMTELRDLTRIKGLRCTRPQRRRREPVPWVPTPHPVYGYNARPESPHLQYLPHHQQDAGPLAGEKQRLSRYALFICAFVPILLLPFGLGWLDFVMRKYTSGRIYEFGKAEKTCAFLLLFLWCCLVIGMAPPLWIAYNGE
ncbi:MAG: hypothetical protein Q9201_004254 [Fulgogasparrea decipioides]